MTETNTIDTYRNRPPEEILNSFDGRRFFRPKHPGLGVLTGKVDTNELMLELFDAEGQFQGCYLSEQLPLVDSGKCEDVIRVLL